MLYKADASNPIEPFQGSSAGIAVVAVSGAYEVIVLGISKPNEPHIYTLRFSEDCIGSIALMRQRPVLSPTHMRLEFQHPPSRKILDLMLMSVPKILPLFVTM